VLLTLPDRRTTRGIRDYAILVLLGEAGPRHAKLCRLNVRNLREAARTANAEAGRTVAPRRS
jgi:site-specific recombinase XerD